jgi:hypothetical protein
MGPRFVKLFALAVGSVGALIILGAGFYLASDYRTYQKVEITTSLMRDGKYDPTLHFSFDRACVFPPKSTLADTWFSQRGYREIGAIFPDTYTNWTLVLVDDKGRTFRTLYVLQSKVKFGGKIICNPKLMLRTANSNGVAIAHVEETGAN